MKKFYLKNKNFYRYFFVFLIIVISFINLRYFWQPGIFRAHDIENHLARIANYYLAIRDGHIPPRWAKNLNHKFGYPVFNYNYPLANILAYPLIVIGFSIEDCLKIILFFAYLFSGLFLYLWLKRYFSARAAFVGAVFYMSAPYQFLDLYVRGVVGENLTFALFPGILYFLKLLSEKPTRWKYLGLTVLTAFFSLSHNIMVLIFTPLIFAYWFYLFKIAKKPVFLKLSLVGLVFGFLTTSFFWLPALLERSYVALNAFDPKTFYQDHFVNLKQLIYSPWQFGYSVSGLKDTMSFQVGLTHWLIVLLSIIIFIGHYVLRDDRTLKRLLNLKALLLFLLLFLLAVFLMLPVSKPIWKILPIIGFLQFPWRFLGLAVFASSVLAVILAEKQKILGLILALVCFAYSQQFTKPFFWEKKSDMIYYDFLFTTSVRHENMPKLFWEGKTDRLKSKFFFEGGPVNFKELVWKTGKHIYEVDVQKESYIFEHTAYFPGWQVFVDGQKTKIEPEHQDYPGLIRFKAPKGRHKVIVKLTETPLRFWANVISLASFIAIPYLIFLSYDKKYK